MAAHDDMETRGGGVEMVDGKPTNVNLSKVENVKDPWKQLNPPK